MHLSECRGSCPHGRGIPSVTSRRALFHCSIHTDVGYVALLLTALCLVWRGVNPTPALSGDTLRRQLIAGRISHAALYLVAGMGDGRRQHPRLFGLVRPCFVRRSSRPRQDHVASLRRPPCLLCLYAAGTDRPYVAAAAWHHFVRRDRVAMRMVKGEAG
jgi:cytochrome b561